MSKEKMFSPNMVWLRMEHKEKGPFWPDYPAEFRVGDKIYLGNRLFLVTRDHSL